ncbi:tRNA pseudouridine synthase A, partial [Achromobacter anxifer]
MSRVALGLAYDGSAWQGWQTQPHRQTVQDTLEAALGSFCGVAGPVPTICAGRTDTGVHGAMQVVHLDTGLDRRMESWVRGVNAFLPPSISVQWAQPVSDEFHARFSARARTYVYLLWRGRV